MTLDFLQNKNVVVTGAAGFIGSHLCDRLLAEGATVIGVDNFLTGRKENIDHLLDGMSGGQDDGNTVNQLSIINNPKFRFIEADVNNHPESYLPKDISIDLVLHFASPASPPRYQKYPVETYLVNSMATHQLLQYLLANHPEARFLFASTSEAYGDPLEHPQKESYWGNVNPNGIRSCYDEAKRLGETICGVHARDFQMDVRIVRIFNTYGPRMDPTDGRVIPQFANEALEGKPLSVFGDGSQTRSYCYVDDLVEVILRYASIENGAGETINIGNPDEYTILETAQRIIDIVDDQILKRSIPMRNRDRVQDDSMEERIAFHPLPKDDPTRRRPDITKAKELLGWEPQVKFEDGLKKTIEYFQSLK